MHQRAIRVGILACLGAALLMWTVSAFWTGVPYVGHNGPVSSTASSEKVGAAEPGGSGDPDSSRVASQDRVELRGAAAEAADDPGPITGHGSDAAAEHGLTLTALCLVDADSSPLSSARMVAAWISGQPTANAEASGDVKLVLPTPAGLAKRDAVWAYVEISAPGYERLFRRALIRRGIKRFDFGVVRFARGARVRGFVRDEQDRVVPRASVFMARATKRDGLDVDARLWGAGIAALSRNSRRFVEGLHATVSDDKGGFSIEGVPLGDCAVCVQKAGFEWFLSQPISLAHDIALPPFTLRSIDAGHQIRGVVLDVDGKPVIGAKLSLTSDETSGSSTMFATVETVGEIGEFLLPAAPGRTYALYVRAWDIAKSEDTVDDYTMHGVSPGRGRLVVRLPALRTLKIRVLGAEDVPLMNARFLATGDGDRVARVTAEHGGDGRYQVRFPDGVSVVEVAAPMHRWKSVHLNSPHASDANGPRTVVLERVFGVIGQVRGEHGALEGVWVHAHKLSEQRGRLFYFSGGVESRLPGPSESAPPVKTDALGRFELPIVERGRYVIHAEREGLGRGESAEFEVKSAADSLVVDVQMNKVGSIEGRVIVPPELVNWRALVVASSGNGHAVFRVVGDRDVDFRFDNLAVGGWQVRFCSARDKALLETGKAFAKGAGEWLRDVTVHPGTTTVVNLNRGLSVQGRIKAAAWPGIRWKFVTLRASGNTHGEVDPQGQFHATMLSPGEMKLVLHARAPGDASVRVWRSHDSRVSLTNEVIDLSKSELSVVGLVPHSEYAAVGSADEWSWSVRFTAKSVHQTLSLPAGVVEIRARERGRRGSDDVATWRLLGKSKLIAGERQEHKLDSPR